jgi:pyrroline-5-carboxylate reductase
MKLFFIGAGAMGEALLRGVLSSGAFAPDKISVYDVAAARVRQLADELGVTAATSPAEAAHSELILLAVKPQTIQAALAPLRDELNAQHTLVSIAAGISTAALEANFSSPVPVVRVMPNTPALVNKAASALCLGAHADAKHLALAHRIFDAVGVAVDCDEKQIDAVTGLSGSGPAYVYVFIEALSDAGVKMGLPRAVATQLAAQTVAGAAQMVLETGQHPGALKDMVTSPGGTTIAALHELENGAFRGTVMNAVEASTLRSRELG